MAEEFKIRSLGPADHAQCVALSADRGWQPARRQWQLLLEQAEVFGIDAPDGHGLAGSVVLGRYGAALASVGMMLVASRYGRRGLGRALLEHLLEETTAGTVYLTATTAGRPLYDKLGFRPIRASAQFTGEFVPEPGGRPVTRPAHGADRPAILDLDKAAFGADRGFLLRHLAGGFASQIRLDIDPDCPGLPGWAAAHGLSQAGQTTFMARGPWPPSADRDRVFALISPALG